MANEKLVDLTPDQILIGDNVRYALKPYRIDNLADSILQASGVRTPITVEKLKTPIDGFDYRLVVGAYRTAAVTKLNTEQSAGLTIPARVIPEMSDTERLLAQVSENTDRENMSPMDKAIAARKMLDAGISKMDVRKSFAAAGGRKGVKIQPASNSHINMLMSFLDFPKDIQKKIHDDVIGIGAAYELSKYPRDKWQPILDKAEADRIKAMDRDDKDEETYLKKNKAIETATQEQEKSQAELEAAKAAAEAAKAAADEKATALLEATRVSVTSKGEEKKAAQAAVKAVQAELNAAQKAAETAEKELGKIEDKAKSAADKAQAAKERLEAARAAKADKVNDKVKVTGKDVKKAAKDTQAAGSKPVKLNAGEMKEAIKSLTHLSTATKHPKTIAAGDLILKCFDGLITDGQLQLGIARLMGEEKMPAPTAAAKPASKK